MSTLTKDNVVATATAAMQESLRSILASDGEDDEKAFAPQRASNSSRTI